MSAPARELMVVRHPETEANVAGRLVGRGDSPLTPAGVRQSVALAERVGAWAPDVIYTSPLGRAASTARAVAPPDTRIVVLDDLAEIDFGRAEGLTWGEMRERGIVLDYSGGPVAPGGETGVAFDARVRDTAAVIVGGTFTRALVVTHGGVFRHMLAALTPMTVADVWGLEVPNAAAAALIDDHGSWRLAEIWSPDL